MSGLAVALVGGGVFFLAISSLGLLRFPDFYSRAHATGKSETLGAILLLVGVAVHLGFVNTSAKLVLILLLIAITNPAGIHALTRAAVHSGEEIWVCPEEERRPVDSGDGVGETARDGGEAGGGGGTP